MSALLIGIALVLAVGLWGFFGSAQAGTPASKPTGVLSPPQIAGYAVNAGFSGQDLVTSVAVALAESSPPGNPNSVGDGGTSYGLWQIHWTVHPEFDKTRLFDPQYNANAAYTLYSRAGGDFTDWTTYNTGKYQSYLQTAEGAASVYQDMVGGVSA